MKNPTRFLPIACFLSLLPLEAKADTSQPASRSEFICSTPEKAEQFNARLASEGLLKRGVPELTSYCEGDIEAVNQACAKSKGVKRRFWCELLTEFCKTMSQLDDSLYQRRVQARRDDEEKAKAERQRQRDERERARAGMSAENAILMMTFDNLLDAGSNLTAYSSPVQQELMPFSCRIPDQEEVAAKKRDDYNRTLQYAASHPLFYPAPTPNFMPWKSSVQSGTSDYLCQACRRDKAFACNKTSGPTASSSPIVASHWAQQCARDCSSACGGP